MQIEFYLIQILIFLLLIFFFWAFNFIDFNLTYILREIFKNFINFLLDYYLILTVGVFILLIIVFTIFMFKIFKNNPLPPFFNYFNFLYQNSLYKVFKKQALWVKVLFLINMLALFVGSHFFFGWFLQVVYHHSRIIFNIYFLIFSILLVSILLILIGFVYYPKFYPILLITRLIGNLTPVLTFFLKYSYLLWTSLKILTFIPIFLFLLLIGAYGNCRIFLNLDIYLAYLNFSLIVLVFRINLSYLLLFIIFLLIMFYYRGWIRGKIINPLISIYNKNFKLLVIRFRLSLWDLSCNFLHLIGVLVGLVAKYSLGWIFYVLPYIISVYSFTIILVQFIFGVINFFILGNVNLELLNVNFDTIARNGIVEGEQEVFKVDSRGYIDARYNLTVYGYSVFLTKVSMFLIECFLDWFKFTLCTVSAFCFKSFLIIYVVFRFRFHIFKIISYIYNRFIFLFEFKIVDPLLILLDKVATQEFLLLINLINIFLVVILFFVFL